jgi:hypothetical protein
MMVGISIHLEGEKRKPMKFDISETGFGGQGSRYHERAGGLQEE